MLAIIMMMVMWKCMIKMVFIYMIMLILILMHMRQMILVFFIIAGIWVILLTDVKGYYYV